MAEAGAKNGDSSMAGDHTSSREKQAADQRRRELQALDAPRAWAAYQAGIETVRARTAQLRAERLAREAAADAVEKAAAVPPAPPKRAARTKKKTA
jgi:hypothetical protein